MRMRASCSLLREVQEVGVSNLAGESYESRGGTRARVSAVLGVTYVIAQYILGPRESSSLPHLHWIILRNQRGTCPHAAGGRK